MSQFTRAPGGTVDRRVFLKLLGIAAAATAVVIAVPGVQDEPALTEVEIEDLEHQIAAATFGALAAGIEIFKHTGDPVSIAYQVASLWAATDKSIHERYPRDAQRILDGAGARVAEQIEAINDEMDRMRSARERVSTL